MRRPPIVRRPAKPRRRPASARRLVVDVPGHSAALAEIRELVAGMAQRAGFDEVAVAQIEMAVDEACSNIIKHAYGQLAKPSRRGRPLAIRLEIRRETDRLVIEVTDQGKPFDSARHRPVALRARIRRMQTNGYGIAIMRRFMDEIEYRTRARTGNTLRLVKYLKKA